MRMLVKSFPVFPDLFCCPPKVVGESFCPVGFVQALSSAMGNAQIFPPTMHAVKALCAGRDFGALG